jgi:FkbM family methyltransferase
MFNLETIYRRIWGGKPRLVAEVGVNEPEKCSVAGFLAKGVEGILVEPLPWCCERLRAAFPTAKVIEGVVGDRRGEVKLYDRGEGSWIEDVPAGQAPDEHPSISVSRDSFDDRFVRTVTSHPWWSIEKHTLDVLCVDTEGAEWFVIRDMRTEPKLIRLEMHFTHTGWRNPFYNEISDRLYSSGYEILGEDVSDILWAKY